MSKKITIQTLKQFFEDRAFPAKIQEVQREKLREGLIIKLKPFKRADISWRLEITDRPVSRKAVDFVVFDLFIPLARLDDMTHVPEIIKEVVDINHNILLGSFGYDPKKQVLFYKYNVLLKREESLFDKDTFYEVIKAVTTIVEENSFRLYKAARLMS